MAGQSAGGSIPARSDSAQKSAFLRSIGQFIIFRSGFESAVDTGVKPAYDDYQLKQTFSNGAIHAY